MGELTAQRLPLTDGAQELLDCACEFGGGRVQMQGLHCWLLSLLHCRGHLAASIAPSLGDQFAMQQTLRRCLEQGDAGEHLPPEELLALAEECACNHGETAISERDLACVILTEAGYALAGEEAAWISDSDCDTVYLDFLTQDEQPDAPPAAAGDATPLLDQLGVDLTLAACRGTLSPVIGRHEEIQLVIETLCRRTKRNPALIGPAGVGKTAIVEGLAQRIAAGQVPAPLQHVRVIMLSVTALVANCKLIGEFEERMTALIKEAGRPDIVLFIDEAHTMMGAGASGRNGNDLANIIKPALARGEIACIAATTDEEYRLFIETDSALERRFQPVHIQELTPQQTLEVLANLRDQLACQRGVEVPAELLEWIINFSGQYLHNRFFPDKAVDMLEQCVAYGMTQGKTQLDQADVETIAQRLVGMPTVVNDRLTQLRDALSRSCLLPTAIIDSLIHRLEVTLRGLDVNAVRPNAVILLLDDAAAQADVLCDAIADCLFGATERIVPFDFSRFHQHADLTMLVGAPPGYVGFEGRLALHRVMQMPWCVLHCDNVQISHPSAREVLTNGLRHGVITLANGKRVFLSDTIIVLTAAIPTGMRNPFGFESDSAPANLREQAAELLGPELLSQVDIICADLRRNDDVQRHWLEDSLLADLSERFRVQGVCLHYDPSLFPWLLSLGSARFTMTDWERLIDEHLCPAIIPYVTEARTHTTLQLRILANDKGCTVERR